MSDWVQPGQGNLKECVVNGMAYVDADGRNNFHVQELRIFEDHCKPYFTGQLIIESHQNTWELFVQKGGIVTITFAAPRSDGGPTKDYTEVFRIHSYDAKEREDDTVNAMVITLSLIGEEYYNDRQNTVLQAFSNIPGSAAAAAIHETYMAENGPLQMLAASTGLIGTEIVPHQVNNKKPIQAIHEILNKNVYAAYPSCAPTYFRNKYGYVMAPLQQLLETARVAQSFMHYPAEGSEIAQVLASYDKVIYLRPINPPSEDTGQNSGQIDGLNSAMAFLDVREGNYLNNFQSIGSVIGGLTGGFQQIAKNFQGQIKSKYGGRQVMAWLDSKHQSPSIAKEGPANYVGTQSTFLTQLSYASKYRVVVPMQTGVNVTCGERINILYPMSGYTLIAKTLYVPRLIHELRFTEGKDRKPVIINATTDIFGVHWG